MVAGADGAMGLGHRRSLAEGGGGRHGGDRSIVAPTPDSSVWIAHLRGYQAEATTKLLEAITRNQVLVGDLILLEILRGARDEAHAARIAWGLRKYAVVPLLDPNLTILAARNYRKLRTLGVTIRKSPDIIIGTFCIEHRHALLHDDRDFAPMEAHLGLDVV